MRERPGIRIEEDFNGLSEHKESGEDRASWAKFLLGKESNTGGNQRHHFDQIVKEYDR